MPCRLVHSLAKRDSLMRQAESRMPSVGLHRAAMFYAVMLGAVLAASPPSMAQQTDLRPGPRPDPAARTPAASPVTAAGTQPSLYEITNALRLTLRFREYPELSGDYRVNADETISISVVGRVRVSGVDAAKLEQILAERLAEITGQASYVTVEVAEYRPVYVTGYVKDSGSFQWRPEMTVLQAVAMANGIYRETGGAETGFKDLSLLRKAIDNQKRAMATLARLRAEQAGAASIEVPPQLVSLVGRAEAERLIEAQTTLFANRRSTLENQLAIIERGKALAAQELEALKQQTQKINAQLELRRDASRKLQDLQSRGLVLAERSLEQEIQVSQLEEKSINIAVAIARVQATLAGFDREAASLKQTREAEIGTEALRLEREVAQNAIEIEALRGESQAQLGEAGPSSRNAKITVSYSITRREGDGTKVLLADETTVLVPGDVLVVAPVIQ